MTNHWVDIKNANVVMVMGGNAAEAHPVGFRWAMEAKNNNDATLIVVDPRFTRTASVADIYAPISFRYGHYVPVWRFALPDRKQQNQRRIR